MGPTARLDNPKWIVVDVFVSRVAHFVPYPLLRKVAANGAPPAGLECIGENGVSAVKDMDIFHRGRLSVQRVRPEAWDVIKQMADKDEDKEERRGGETRPIILSGGMTHRHEIVTTIHPPQIT
ncbi:hypothetical protein EI94DRAFT_298487 [Lactarius quietus]|nr:hypothetical protein EI94DRAFT_298487 [Lactarius quietus]